MVPQDMSDCYRLIMTRCSESGAIVVISVGTGVPWFLTEWAEGTEIEFMIDTGCQVTILSMLGFELMCTARLRLCHRRLVSAYLSTLLFCGELCMAVIFPGLHCDMLLVVASIGSDGLLETEAL